jgi:hypothetical protein
MKLFKNSTVILPTWFAVLLLALTLGASFIGTVAAQGQIIEASQGAPGKKGAWFIQGVGAGGAVIVVPAAGGGFGIDETKELGVPSAVTLAANVSGSICGLTVSRMYEIQCTAAAAFRSGAATPTALLTDNPLAAATKQNITLGAASTCFAFISGSAATCTASLHAL